MKRIIITAALLLALTGALAKMATPAQSVGPMLKIVRWDQIGQVKLGMTRAQVEARYGRPLAMGDGQRPGTKFYYEVAPLGVFYVHNIVREVFTDSWKYRTDDGYGPTVAFRPDHTFKLHYAYPSPGAKQYLKVIFWKGHRATRIRISVWEYKGLVNLIDLTLA